MSVNPLKILWVQAGPLHPLDKGGNIRTYNMLKALKKKHEITYLALASNAVTETQKSLASEYCHKAHWLPSRNAPKNSFTYYGEVLRNCLFSNLPYAVERYCSTEMFEVIETYDQRREFDLIICDFLAVSGNFKRRLSTPSILFQHNVESMIWRGYKRAVKNLASKFYFGQQANRMLRYEQNIENIFHGEIAVSKNDANRLKSELRHSIVLGDVPTGVDVEFFKPQGLPKRPFGIVFSGSMDWMPNEDGILHFAKSIYPTIKKIYSGATLTIVGRNPTANVLSLARMDNSIIVTGTVDDVRPSIETSQVYIVPLRIGSGTRIKIFEAMSMGMPVVSTTIGAEGLPVSHNEEIMIADEPELFANAVIELFNDAAKRERLSSKARCFVTDHFGWDKVASEFELLAMKVLEGR